MAAFGECQFHLLVRGLEAPVLPGHLVRRALEAAEGGTRVLAGLTGQVRDRPKLPPG
jgi:hypothetical protein